MTGTMPDILTVEHIGRQERSSVLGQWYLGNSWRTENRRERKKENGGMHSSNRKKQGFGWQRAVADVREDTRKQRQKQLRITGKTGANTHYFLKVQIRKQQFKWGSATLFLMRNGMGKKFPNTGLKQTWLFNIGSKIAQL